MNIHYDKYQMTNPYECIVIVKYTNGQAQYYTEDGVSLDVNLAWSGWAIEGNIPTPSWDQNQPIEENIPDLNLNQTEQ